MHILISGASGLIGSSLAPRLSAAGHRISRLVRVRAGNGARSSGRGAGDAAVPWDPESGVLDASCLAGVDAVIHLSGESIAGGPWSTKRRELIRNSRIRTTRLLAETLAQVSPRPAVLVQAAAVGYYGSRGEETLTEASSAGTGFLADLCRDWEAASMPAQDAGVRVVRLRTAPVLSAKGGMLAAILPIFRLGLGGRLGSGRQWMSWISLDDQLSVIERALTDSSMRGSINAASPEPVRNATFTKALGRAIHRPTILPAPEFALHMVLGRSRAEELLLTSQRVAPEALLACGFRFAHPRLEEALRAVL
ncbi:MAG TPA: TIGR01777 family oxidoreductase [Candidatus Eisenbacteria bacterium]|nr:TIGR01777 family oxidoreductase [Candidatus Eisenbacteria bacterium]